MARGTAPKLSPILICSSGGIDSSALIPYYLEQGFTPRLIHFEYGHNAYAQEKKALDAIARFYKLKPLHTRLRPPIASINPKNGELIGRNAIIALSALAYLPAPAGLIALGIHAGPPPYYDCSPDFVKQMQSILDGYLGGTIVLDAPWLHFHKKDIITWARQKRMPLELTYSCQLGSDPPCGACASCMERRAYGL